MYYNGVLPFIDKGFMIKNLSESVSIDSIYCPISLGDGAEVGSVSGMPNVLCVQPLNIYVFNEVDERAYAFKRDLKGKVVECNVTYIDYYDVSKKIIVEENKALLKQNRSFIDEDIVSDVLVNLSSNNLSITENDMEILNQLTLGVISKKVSFDEFMNSGVVSEAFNALDFFKDGKNLSSNSNIADKTDTIYEYLDSYFSSNSNDAEKVPLLIGPTGVFKSATVKKLCEKHDFRLVDFRVAFTARLDYSGLFERLKIRMGYCEDEHVTVLDKSNNMTCSVCGKEIKRVENEQYSYSCPMEELVTCSDGFREYCKQAIVVLQEQLDSGVIEVSGKSNGGSNDVTSVDLTEEQKKAIREMLDKYTYYAKTPVMFFDEITRCQDKGVEGVLMTLLNQKTFQNLSLKGCKFVAATNLDLGDSDLDRLYDVNRNTDSAFTARFTPIKVTPESVRDRWLDWAEQDRKGYNGDKNIHPELLEYLRDNPGEIYNKEYVKQVYFENYDEKEAAATSFPNYRTWDLVSQYIYKELNMGNTLMNFDTIKGLIGKTSADMLFSWLVKRRSTIQKNTTIEKKDEVDSFLKTNLDANVPAMIIGPSSLGKTTRVMNYAKSINAEVIAINLASKSKSDLMGMPVKETLNSYVVGDLATKSLKGLTDKLGKVLKDVKESGHGVVDVMTLRAPDSTIKEQFLKAYNEGRDIILFFDECNRVTNPAVLSIMFECISDNRIFGINYDPRRVKVVGACNMGENYRNANKLDPALTARFSIYWKKEYDLDDVDSFIQYIEKGVNKGESHEVVLSFLKNVVDTKGKGYVLEWLKRVEEGTIENAEPSSRSFYQLSKEIKNMEKSKSFCGRVIFDTDAKDNIRAKLYSCYSIDDTYNSMNAVVDIIEKGYKNWAPIKSNESITIDGEVISAKELVTQLLFLKNEIKDYNKFTQDELEFRLKVMTRLVEEINNLDDYIEDLRATTFEYFLGEDAGIEFTKFFNINFGTSNVKITIPMLSDSDLIADFYSQNLATEILSTEDIVDRVVAWVEDFWKEFGDSLPYENYESFLTNAFAYMNNGDTVALFLNRLPSDLDSFLVKVEEGGNNIIKRILQFAGYVSVTDTQLDTIRDSIKSSGSKGKSTKSSKLL